jgi:hypothetical protein
MPPKPENWTCRVLYDTNAVETPKPKRVKYHNKKPKGFSVTNQDIVKAGGHARAANGATASYTPIPKKGVRATVTHQEAVVQPSINTAPPISETAEEEFMLSDEQRNIYDAVVRDKKNVFFTGAAGMCMAFLIFITIKNKQYLSIFFLYGKCVLY